MGKVGLKWCNAYAVDDKCAGEKIIFVQQMDQEMELPFEVRGMGKLQVNGSLWLRIKDWGCWAQVSLPAKSPVADELWNRKTPAFAAILCLIFTSVPLEDLMLSYEDFP